jgi:hypothetical protein
MNLTKWLVSHLVLTLVLPMIANAGAKIPDCITEGKSDRPGFYYVNVGVDKISNSLLKSVVLQLSLQSTSLHICEE